ncbi:MAG TPA: nicotinate-nucleotide adenylyltransferase [Rhodanobacteraceae bacterium]|nr:nicotinate-nucleotide adenylyltransferase [Rhodanobacteraceae bacterium]
MRPLAILGGTFDPVHNGHLRVALEAGELLDAEVRLIPCGIPPHRPPPVAGPAQRAALLRAALAGQHRIAVDERELHRDGPSYSFDTMAELREEIGAERPLILLLGADAFGGLPSWHRWRDLFDLAHVGVLTRPGHDATLPIQLRTKIASRRTRDPLALSTSPAGRVLAIEVSPLEISASGIRDLIAAGRDPRWLVPDALLADGSLIAVYRQSASPAAPARGR